MTESSRAKFVLLVGPLALPKGGLRAEMSRLGKEGPVLTLAVDGGVTHFKKAGLMADLAVGDFDSVRSLADLKAAYRVKRFPADKDSSDFALALAEISRFAGAGGVTRVLGIGLLGSRPDHELSNLLELSGFVRRAGKALPRLSELRLKGAQADFYFLSGAPTAPRRLFQLSLGLARGAIFSVFSLNGTAKEVNVSGAAYPLKGAVLAPGSRGLSNVARAKLVKIRVAHGDLAVVVPRLK